MIEVLDDVAIDSEKDEELCERANTISQQAEERYGASITMNGSLMENQYTTIDSFLTLLGERWPSLRHPILELIEDDRTSSLGHPFPSKLAPLDECISLILWS